MSKTLFRFEILVYTLNKTGRKLSGRGTLKIIESANTSHVLISFAKCPTEAVRLPFSCIYYIPLLFSYNQKFVPFDHLHPFHPPPPSTSDN